MDDLSEVGCNRKTSLSPDFSDLERTLIQGDVDTYSRNMDRLFAEDEKNNAPSGSLFGSISSSQSSIQIDERRQPTTIKNRTYFTAAAFWKRRTDSMKVGVILTRLEHNEKLYFLMYDANKVVLKKQLVDDIEFYFDKKDFGIRLDLKNENAEHVQSEAADTTGLIEVKFVDFLTFSRFGVTALIRSNNHSCFKLSDGSGDVNIDENCDIRYNITDHSLDEEDGMGLPNERKGVKTRLNKEKISEHMVYKWITGLQKGCHLLIKATERSVYEIIIDKIRKPVDFLSALHSELNEPIDSNIGDSERSEISSESREKALDNETITEKMRSPDTRRIVSEIIPVSEEHVGMDRMSTSPLPLLVDSSSNWFEQQPPAQSTGVEDTRDILHRIVGIELDRIEMRLNAKLERFQNDINARLDQQTELLKQILDNSLSR